MPGIQDFTYANIGKETVRGTPVAPTRKLYVDGTGRDDGPDLSKSFHEAENRGLRTRIGRTTSQAEDAGLKLSWSDGVSWDDLVLVASSLKGGLTGVGGAADKTWTCVPSLTAANSPESWSVDAGDDVQNWRYQYVMARTWKLSSALGELTGLEGEFFAQRSVKTAKATPADNAAPKIPGDLWTIKFATTLAGLAGASIVSNFLIGWELELTTGLIWRHYMDGNLYGSQHVETSISANLTLTVESTAQAVSQFSDKYAADTLDFIRLKATGGSLGGSAYSAQLDLPVLYDRPSIIDSQADGINLWKIPAKLSVDSLTSPTQSIGLVLVNSLSALP